jgi:hypothetical protein
MDVGQVVRMRRGLLAVSRDDRLRVSDLPLARIVIERLWFAGTCVDANRAAALQHLKIARASAQRFSALCTELASTPGGFFSPGSSESSAFAGSSGNAPAAPAVRPWCGAGRCTSSALNSTAVARRNSARRHSHPPPVASAACAAAIGAEQRDQHPLAIHVSSRPARQSWRSQRIG